MGDWLSTQYITSQVFVSIAYLLLASTYFITQRRRLLLTVITSNTSMGIGFALLGGWVAVGMCIIAICRDIVSDIINSRRSPADKMKITKSDWWWLALWISLFTTVMAFTQTGFMTLFAYFATMTFTISIWQKNQFIYRFLGIFVGIFWITYNVVVKSFMGITLESALLIFVIAGLIQYCIKERKSKR
ncbi:MAG: YgjV family protein [Alphaproteobacteria bacterium]|nr:YgjV family protein [Alphaproteobacteria bacterium]